MLSLENFSNHLNSSKRESKRAKIDTIVQNDRETVAQFRIWSLLRTLKPTSIFQKARTGIRDNVGFKR